MLLMFSAIIGKILKFCFGFSFILGTAVTANNMFQFIEEEFLNNIQNAIPTQVALILGIIYGIIIVATKADNFLHTFHMNKIKRKEEREKLEQQEIETDKKRQELKNDTL